MRVIVFGSRTWEHVEIVQYTLVKLFRRVAKADLLITHGDCPTGADRLAQQWAEAYGVTTERHPADWRGKGRAAGPIRNREMCELGAWLAIGFRDVGESPGTDGMIELLKEHHIPGHVVRLEQWQ